MEFSFTDEQQMISDTAAAFLAEVSDSAAVRAAVDAALGAGGSSPDSSPGTVSGSGASPGSASAAARKPAPDSSRNPAPGPAHDQVLWRRICEEMCWPGMHIPERHGGLGLGYVELAVTLEQMGRRLLCSPFYATVCLGANTLLVAGSEAQRAEYLPQLAAGRTATLAWAGANGRWDASGVEATWAPEGGDFVLNGVCRHVPDGHSADLLLVAARAVGSAGADGIGLFVLPADAPGVSREWLPTMDPTRRLGQVRFDDVRVGREQALGEAGAAGPQLATVLDLATVAAAAEQAGGASQVLDMTVAYTLERVQFNRPIASYQAVKHKAADMMVKAEAARSAVYYAACIAQEALAAVLAEDGSGYGAGESSEELSRAGAGDGAEDAPGMSPTDLAAQLPEAASVAKAWCSDAYFFNAGTGIQLHGGVGFTWEYDIQLYFKRARSSEVFLGDATWHRERIAQQLLDGEIA